MRFLSEVSQRVLDSPQGMAAWLTGVRANFLALRSVRVVVTQAVTLDFPSVAAAGVQDLTAAVTGATLGDAVIVTPPAGPTAGLLFFGWVSAADQVTVRASNITSAPIDPASGNYNVAVIGVE